MYNSSSSKKRIPGQNQILKKSKWVPMYFFKNSKKNQENYFLQNGKKKSVAR